MKTVQEWNEYLTCAPMNPQEALRSVRIKPQEIEAIQRDAVIHGLKEALRLMNQEQSIDFGPGKILRKIEELEKQNLDLPETSPHRENV